MQGLKKLLTVTLVALSSITWAQNNTKPYEGTTLNLLYFELPFLRGLQELIPEFTEATGIDVNFEFLSETAAYQKIQVELASRTGNYDVVGTQSSFVPLYAQNNWLIPVEEFSANPELADSELLNIDDFIPSTLEALANDDQQYCLPFFAATVILYYQLDVFEKYGITEPPATFADLLKVAETIHTEELPAIALRGIPSVAGNIWHWNLFLYGQGGKYFQSFPDDLTPVINSEQAVQAADIFLDLKRNFSPRGAANYTYDDVVIAMQQGRVAMAIEGAPLAGQILDPDQSRVVDNIGFAVVPGGPAGQFPAFTAHGLCIAADSSNAEAAYKFIEWATSADILTRVALATTHVAVPRNSVWENEDFIAKYDYNYGGGSFLTAFRESLDVAPPTYYPPFAAWPQVGDRVGEALQALEVNGGDTQSALDAANTDVQQILIDNGFLSE